MTYPAAHWYVAGCNEEAKDVFIPSFLPLDLYPEEEQNTLVSEEIFQKAEEKYHYPIIDSLTAPPCMTFL